MSSFEIKQGRTLTIDDSRCKSNICISTNESNNQNQIGTIRSEMKGLDITIFPLYNQFSYYKADGVYMVELGENISLQQFLEVLADSINKYCETDINYTVLQAEDIDTVKLPYVDTFTLYMLQISLLIMLILVFLYSIFSETKKLSIIKLFGNDNHIIFWNYQKNFLLSTVLSIIFSAIYSYIMHDNPEYLISFFCRISIFAFLQFCIMSVILLIIMWKANILKGLKGGYSGNHIHALNIMAKIICICVVIYSGQTVFDTIKDSAVMESKMRNWEIADNYGIFYPFYIGFEMSDSEEKTNDITIGRDLYSYFNHNGALFVDANQFEQEFLEINKSHLSDWQLNMSVNPNYLQVFPLYDTDGKRIQINEDEHDLILLVPEKYSSYEEEIISYYQNNQRDKISKSLDYYGINCDELRNQSIRIIWLKNNQGIFGFSTRVMSDDEGYIVNPITIVITENNSTILDRIGILGKGDLDPLKVFVGNYENSYEAYKVFSQTLNELNLDDNLKNLVSINENINERIIELKVQRRIALIMVVISILLLVILVIQNTVLDFHKNRQKYIIKKIHGLQISKIYGKHLLFSDIVYIIIGIAFILYI